MLDVIYVAASSQDARYSRICVSSIRYFYPDVPIKLLAGGQLELGLAEELEKFWNVELAAFPQGNWGWGFIKLEPLFSSVGERFMVLDSDTVFTGNVLDCWNVSKADFLVDDEQKNEADTHRLYYNWRKITAVDPKAQPPQFVFNSGQWFGTSGVLTREDFAYLLDWDTMPPKLRYPDSFMPGDQGILNYVLNQKSVLDGLKVGRCKLMRWPGHGLDDLSVEAIASRQAPPLVIHWAGMKKPSFSAMVGSDILRFFENQYYQKLPYGSIRKLISRIKYPLSAYINEISTRVRLKLRSVTQNL